MLRVLSEVPEPQPPVGPDTDPVGPEIPDGPVDPPEPAPDGPVEPEPAPPVEPTPDPPVVPTEPDPVALLAA
jgi:hypothetical protein